MTHALLRSRSDDSPHHGAAASRAPLLHPFVWLTLSDAASLRGIRREWTALAERADAGLCLTPEWIESWHETIAPDARPQVITAWDAAGRLAALWPLCVRRWGGARLRWRVLETMGGAIASGDRLNPLRAAPGLEHELALHARRTGRREADQIRWNELSVEDSMTRALVHGSEQRGWRICDRRPLPILPLPARGDAFLAGLSANRRGLIRRRERQAARLGLTFRTHCDGPALPAALEQFMALHASCWSARGGTGNFADPRLAAFLTRFAQRAADRGWVRLHCLCDGESPVAAMLVIHFAGRAYYYQSGWSPAAAAVSPGMLCLSQAIRGAIDEGLDLFDFMRGDEEYKSHWATESERTLTIIEPLTTRGRLMVLGRDAKEGIRRGVTRTMGPAAWTALKSRLAPRRSTAREPVA